MACLAGDSDWEEVDVRGCGEVNRGDGVDSKGLFQSRPRLRYLTLPLYFFDPILGADPPGKADARLELAGGAQMR